MNDLEDNSSYRVSTSEWDFDSGYLTLSWQGGKWDLNLVDFCKYMAINKDKSSLKKLKQVFRQCLQELSHK